MSSSMRAGTRDENGWDTTHARKFAAASMKLSMTDVKTRREF